MYRNSAVGASAAPSAGSAAAASSSTAVVPLAASSAELQRQTKPIIAASGPQHAERTGEAEREALCRCTRAQRGSLASLCVCSGALCRTPPRCSSLRCAVLASAALIERELDHDEKRPNSLDNLTTSDNGLYQFDVRTTAERNASTRQPHPQQQHDGTDWREGRG